MPVMSEELQLGLIVQHHIHEGAVDFQTAVVFDEAKLPKLIHETTDVRTRRADHFRQHFVAYLGHDTFGLAVFAIAGEQQKDASQTLLTGVKNLVHQVRFIPDVAREHVSDEEFRKIVALVKRGHHDGLFNPDERAVGDGGGSHHAKRLACDAAFAKEIAPVKYPDDRSLALLGSDGELHSSFLGVKDGASRISLDKDIVILTVFDGSSFRSKSSEKTLDIKTWWGPWR